MSLKTHKFARKPFYVDAVRVTAANMEDVAEWCKGTIETSEEGTYISVEVYRPLNPRQTQAFAGDWVLFSGNGFKVYTPKAFDKAFEKVKTLTKAQADEAGIKVPHEPRQPKKPVSRKGIMEVGRAIREAQAKKDDVDYRSAETGQYVSEKTAKENPSTTVAETQPAKTKEDVEADKLIDEVLRKK